MEFRLQPARPQYGLKRELPTKDHEILCASMEFGFQGRGAPEQAEA